jgi:hypothetical protein
MLKKVCTFSGTPRTNTTHGMATMTDTEFTEQLIALARCRYDTDRRKLPRDALMIGILNTLTLALASTVADRMCASDDERGTIFFEMLSGIQSVTDEVISRNRQNRTTLRKQLN